MEDNRLVTICVIADKEALAITGFAIVGAATVMMGLMYGGYKVYGSIRQRVKDR